MRIINNQIEYVVKCNCGLKIAYVEHEIGHKLHCPRCNHPHHLDGKHDMYTLDKTKIFYSTKKLPENKKDD